MGNFFEAIKVMIVGMVVVFVGLIILIGAIYGMTKVLEIIDDIQNGRPLNIGKNGKKKDDEGEADKKTETVMQVVSPIAAAPVVETAKNDQQLIAVITAALMAFEQNGKRLVVRAVRKVSPTSNWASAGRQEQINY